MSSRSPRPVGHSPIRLPTPEAKDGELGITEIKLTGRRGSMPRTDGVGETVLADRISYLQEATETLTKRIEMEKRKGDDLEKKIKISRNKLDECRARMKGSDEPTAIRQRAKAVKSAEHRLDVIMARLNTMNKHNESKKADIESFRRDKLQRQRILKRLQREVAEARRRMETVTVEAASATDGRDKAEREIQAIQATIQREAAQFEAEFTQKISVFTEGVQQRRKAAEVETLQRQDSARGEHSASQSALVRPGASDEMQGSMTVEQEIELKHRSTKTLWEIARREVEMKQQSTKLAELEEAFAKIQEFTGITTIDEMVNAFVLTEDRNYAVLTMINDLNREIEAAEVENASLRNAVEEARAKGSLGYANRDKLAKDWESQIENLRKRTASYDKMYEGALRALDALKPGVHSIFQKVGSTDTAATETLAAAGVTDTNIMTHLGLIEQRVSELCQMYEMAQQGIPLTLPTEEEEAMAHSPAPVSPKLADVEISRVGGIGSTENARMRRNVVSAPVPPSLADLDESDDDDVFLTMQAVNMADSRGPSQRRPRRTSGAARQAEEDNEFAEPLSLEELREHTIALVARKQAKAERRDKPVESGRVSNIAGTIPGRVQRVSIIEPQLTSAAISTLNRNNAASAPAGESSAVKDPDAFLVPRPPSQPAIRSAHSRPGTRGRT